MLHNIFRMNRMATIQMVTLAILGLAGSASLAGEAIVIPGEKSKTAAPIQNSSGSVREIFPFRESAPPIDVLTVPMEPMKLDPKEEKRRRLQALEKKNWMFVQEGELQSEEGNFLNVRDYSLEGLEKRDESGNLMFRPLSKDDARRIPGQFRSAKNEERTAENEGASTRGSEFSTKLHPEGQGQAGAHMSQELNFRQMFEPRQSGSDSLAPKFNKSDLTLHSLLNSGNNTDVTREQQVRRDEFRNFLNKPANPLAGPGDPINSRNDFTRQPLNPTVPVGANSPGSTPGFSPGLPTLNSPRPAAGASAPGFAAGSFLSPESARPAQRAPISYDPPKRKF
jgi:hypothetical protein